MIEISDPLGLEEPRRAIPHGIPAMTAGMAVVAVLLTLASVRTGMGRISVENPRDPPIAVLSISFLEAPASGRIDVVEEPGGKVILSLDAGEGGFMRGILRPLRRERLQSVSPSTHRTG